MGESHRYGYSFKGPTPSDEDKANRLKHIRQRAVEAWYRDYNNGIIRPRPHTGNAKGTK